MFLYPRTPDVLWVSTYEVLCKINPMTPIGRVYKIKKIRLKTHALLSETTGYQDSEVKNIKKCADLTWNDPFID